MSSVVSPPHTSSPATSVCAGTKTLLAEHCASMGTTAVSIVPLHVPLQDARATRLTDAFVGLLKLNTEAQPPQSGSGAAEAIVPPSAATTTRETAASHEAPGRTPGHVESVVFDHGGSESLHAKSFSPAKSTKEPHGRIPVWGG